MENEAKRALAAPKDFEHRLLSLVFGAALGLIAVDVYRQPHVLNCLVLAITVLGAMRTVLWDG